MCATICPVVALMLSLGGPVMAYEVGRISNGDTIYGDAGMDALIELGPGDGVANTLVFPTNVSKGESWPAEGKRPKLNNKNSRFEPAMQVIQGGEVAVINKNLVLHNTHGYCDLRTAFNTTLPKRFTDDRATLYGVLHRPAWRSSSRCVYHVTHRLEPATSRPQTDPMSLGRHNQVGQVTMIGDIRAQ